ncbi:MAG TPA: tetratricopeptide repeat protein, partial [Saprospiraceae bacterium]|nr:tetratricopeptide repeat protein [Saprospiraceae bacterium]
MVQSRYVLFALLCIFTTGLYAQDDFKDLQKAEKYFELRDFDSAEKRFRKILDENPDHDDALWRLGDIAWLQYDFEEAFTFYGIASGLSWRSDEHIRRYIEMLLLNKMYDQGHKWALNLEAKNPALGTPLVKKVLFAKKHHNDPSSYQLERHGMNSEHSDFGANFLAEDYLVFSSSRTDIKRVLKEKGQDNWAGQAFNQLFVGPASQSKNLDQPLFLQTDLENNYNEGPLGISGDGDWVVVTKNNFLDGHSQVYTPGIEMSLYLGRLDDKGKWRDLQPFEHNLQGFASGMGALNESGDVMYFASDRPDGFGGFDLYRSVKTKDGWTYPRNMGPAINTPGNEITPFISGNELYFSSDLHPGLGGFDVYRAELKEKGHSTKIYHMGTGINTAYDESYFIYQGDQDLGFVSSNRTAGFAEDLFRVKGLGKRVRIKILDAKTNEGLSGAVIDLKDCDNKIMKTDRDGLVSMRLMQDVKCNIRITKDGYGLIEIPFNTGERQYWELALHKNEAAGESQGRVLDNKGMAVSRVYVKAIDTESGFYIESITEDDGSYTMNLDPNTFYKFEFLKSGYQPHSISLSTEEVLSPDLPPVRLSEKRAKKSIKEKAASIEKAAPTKEGYALQIGAFKELESVNLSNYSDIADLGTLFTVEENGIFKLRLGVYENER